MAAPTMHVPDIINEGRISAFQYMIVLLCALVMLIDGFDTQAISYMAPLMAKEWGVSRVLLGPIFASALVDSWSATLHLRRCQTASVTGA